VKEHALALAAKGFKVFPLTAGAKAPPLLNGWPQKATSDPKEIELFWLVVPQANIGIHCENLVVLDVDIKKGGLDALNLLRLTEDVPSTLFTHTPTGGEHHYFRLPAGHRGVSNGVDTLGRGIDIRSTGGYVVAPGSVVAAGTYAFHDPAAEIAPAPTWLLERLAPVRDVAPASHAPVADAADQVVERARDWLRTAKRSVKGAGGDQTAYMVACGLRDLGVSYVQACELMRSDAWDHGCGWRDGFLESKPIRSAYRYAENEAGSKAAAPEDFPVVAGDTSAPPVAGTPKAQRGARTLAELADEDAPGAGYAIKGMLQRASYAEIYGAPGEGKTFVALDMAYHVAAGLPWMGRKVHAGPVLYLAYEGQGGLKKRAKALRQKYGKKDVPLYVDSATYNLREKGGREALGHVLSALPAKPVLVVIDTFARALMGGDENSAQDVGSFNAAVAALIESTGACVLIVHHSGKDKSKGARGSSALLGAIDTEIEVDGRQVIARKQRDVELLEPIGFKLVPVLVGLDADGDELTSCVVEAGPVGAARSKVSPSMKKALKTLEEMSPSNAPVDLHDWKDRCKTERGMANSSFYQAKDELREAGLVVLVDGCYTRRMT
jgi:hypothetical protein